MEVPHSPSFPCPPLQSTLPKQRSRRQSNTATLQDQGRILPSLNEDKVSTHSLSTSSTNTSDPPEKARTSDQKSRTLLDNPTLKKSTIKSARQSIENIIGNKFNHRSNINLTWPIRSKSQSALPLSSTLPPNGTLNGEQCGMVLEEVQACRFLVQTTVRNIDVLVKELDEQTDVVYGMLKTWNDQRLKGVGVGVQAEEKRIEGSGEAAEGYLPLELGDRKFMDDEVIIGDCKATEDDMQDSGDLQCVDATNSSLTTHLKGLEAQNTRLTTQLHEVNTAASDSQAQTSNLLAQIKGLEAQNSRLTLQNQVLDTQRQRLDAENERIKNNCHGHEDVVMGMYRTIMERAEGTPVDKAVMLDGMDLNCLRELVGEIDGGLLLERCLRGDGVGGHKVEEKGRERAA